MIRWLFLRFLRGQEIPSQEELDAYTAVLAEEFLGVR